ncbi:MAG: hypothetical protein OXB93_04290, partial [Cytophagales bacterium]|nr:hypothetical protein [Cytophagales bacterium]
MMRLTVWKFNFRFKFLAKTSRDSLRVRPCWFLRLTYQNQRGWGECAPLRGLSTDKLSARRFISVQKSILSSDLPSLNNLSEWISHHVPPHQASFQMGLEMAMRNLILGGNNFFPDNPFQERQEKIPINGLIWMGNPEFMEKAIQEKLQEGYDCLKIKIGGLDFETEYNILKKLRKTAPS